MDYNTQRKPLPLPEYGRNIQQMVDHILTIKDKAKRTQQAKIIINTMLTLSPQLKNTEDYERKLWDHLHIMANFQLDVDSKYPAPTPEEIYKAPEKLPYPSRTKRTSHYGNIAPAILETLTKMPDQEEKTTLARLTANQMKRNYLQWNKNAVQNLEILQDVKRLSHGKIELPEDTELIEESAMAPTNSSKKPATYRANAGLGNINRTNRRRKKKKR